MTTYTVGELASMAGITVRTLHHYDQIGLLTPSGRTAGGYRVYDEEAIERLRTILTYRELGLSLEETAEAIDHDADAALRTARDRVFDQIDRLEKIAASLTLSLADTTQGDIMTPEEKLAVFGDFDPDAHTDEVLERWGDSGTYRESIRRTATYDADTWVRIRAENDAISRRFVALMDAGVLPDAAEARVLVDEHRAHISRWYYECTPQIHAGLGVMYATDPRFAKNIDKAGDGLSAYLSDAIAAAYDSLSEERS